MKKLLTLLLMGIVAYDGQITFGAETNKNKKLEILKYHKENKEKIKSNKDNDIEILDKDEEDEEDIIMQQDNYSDCELPNDDELNNSIINNKNVSNIKNNKNTKNDFERLDVKDKNEIILNNDENNGFEILDINNENEMKLDKGDKNKNDDFEILNKNEEMIPMKQINDFKISNDDEQDDIIITNKNNDFKTSRVNINNNNDFEIFYPNEEDKIKINPEEDDDFAISNLNNNNVIKNEVENIKSNTNTNNINVKYPTSLYSQEKINKYDKYLTIEQKKILDYFKDWSYNILNTHLAFDVQIQFMTTKKDKELTNNIIIKMINFIKKNRKNQSYLKSITNTVSDMKNLSMSYINSNYQADISNHEMEDLFLKIFGNNNFYIIKEYLVDIIHRNIYKVKADIMSGNIKTLTKEYDQIISHDTLLNEFQINGYEVQALIKQQQETDKYKQKLFEKMENDLKSIKQEKELEIEQTISKTKKEMEIKLQQELQNNYKETFHDEISKKRTAENEKILSAKKQELINKMNAELDELRKQKINEINSIIIDRNKNSEIQLKKKLNQYNNELQKQTDEKLKPIDDQLIKLWDKYDSITDEDIYSQDIPETRRELLRKFIQSNIADKEDANLYVNQINNELNYFKEYELFWQIKSSEAVRQITEGYITNPYIIQYMKKNYPEDLKNIK